jgi:hypothetical protein
MLQHQWAIVLYTCGVVLLGFFLYAALQVARKLKVPFCHNPDVSDDVWTPGAVAASFAALPAFAVAVVLRHKLDLPSEECVAFAVSLGCLVWVAVWGGVCWLGKSQQQHPYNSLDLNRGHSSHLLSIPEVGERGPMMTAFLHDSVVHSDIGVLTADSR